MTASGVTAPPGFRWRLESEAPPQLALIEEVPVRTIGKGAYTGLEFLEVRSKRIVNQVAPGPYPFRHTINPYRGCSHACVYCFARPTHEYLGLDTGHDFDTKIVVKVNAPELAHAELDPAQWNGSVIALGTNTDPYQAAEGKYRLTRGVLEALLARRNRFSILTKSPLLLRDLDILREAADSNLVLGADFSIGTLDEDVWRATEPGTPHPGRRMRAVQHLNEAGVPSGVIMGPVLPGLSDDAERVEQVVVSAIAAGARAIHAIPLHLKPGVKEHYMGWLAGERAGLLPLHRARYEGRAYPPRAIQARLAARINRIIDSKAPPEHPIRRSSPPPVPKQVPQPRQQTLPLG